MGGEPVGDGAEGGGDDKWGDVFLRVGFERGFDAVFLLDPPAFGEAWEVEKGEVVEMEYEPLGFFFEGSFFVKGEFGDAVFGGVDRLAACYP